MRQSARHDLIGFLSSEPTVHQNLPGGMFVSLGVFLDNCQGYITLADCEINQIVTAWDWLQTPERLN